MEELIGRFRYPLLLFLGGLLLTGVSVLFLNKSFFGGPTEVEVVEDVSKGDSLKELVVEVSGGVQSPGVYRFQNGERIDDALVKAGGLSATADREWVDKTLNRAAKLTDGQKVYIPLIGEQTKVLSAKMGGGDQSGSSQNSAKTGGLTNINTASQQELEALPGIGPVYAQNIIAQRPYSNIEELLSKAVLKTYVYEKIKNLVSVY